MKTEFVEAVNGTETNPMNWGKFCVGQWEPEEWSRQSAVDTDRSLLASVGQGTNLLLVLDLQTCEGAFFAPQGYARADLCKHNIWVCVLYEAFLDWLYTWRRANPEADLAELPDVVALPDVEFAMQGYRRDGQRRARA